MTIEMIVQHAAELPHGVCYLWQPGLLWLHAGSDALIGAAYVSIPFTLARFLRLRRDVPFNWMMWCFALFILACGATHWLAVLNIWVPSWWTTGAVKALTAAASLPTAMLLSRLVPQMVALPSPTQLQAANTALAAEVGERLRAEKLLRDTQADLERRVEQRTSELARANASLRLLESAVAQASDAFTITTSQLDPPGPRIVFANPALTAMTGYALDDLLGQTPRVLQGPHTDRDLLARLRQTIEAGETFTGETINYRRDGSEFLMSLRVAPLRDAAGRTTHYVAVQHDATEQRSLEQQLRQAQKMEAVGQLAGGIAHDFNNLLTAIQGNCSLLRAELDQEDTRHEYLAEIEDAGERATRLTRQLLSFSRRQVRQPAAVNLDTALTDWLRLVRRLLGEQVEVRFTPTEGLGLVWVDPNQLEQVVLNLAVNARDAMPSGGALTIETRNVDLGAEYAGLHMAIVPGPYVMLCVSDTGVGIPTDTISRIFEPFFTTKAPGKGTGLGLATVYGIVKQSRGNIFVYSEPGYGTTFKIYLPRVPDTAIAAASGPADTAELVPGQGTVLLAEDDEAVRALAGRILVRAGYTVVPATTTAHALAIAGDLSQPMDVLLADVVMPGMTGPALAAAVRELRPDVRVVFMSGYTDSVLEEREVLGTDAVLVSKPFTPYTLTAPLAWR